jgi:ABC-type molybdate transport system permease subunit
MVVLRFVAFLAVIAIGIALALGLYTRNRRYFDFAWQLFKFFLVLVALVLGFFVLERLIVVI